MKARVKEDGRLNVVTAFSGREYTKREWRPVPEGFEAAAEAHPLLVTSDELAAESKPDVSEVTDESSGASVQRGGGRSRRQRDG